MIAHAATELEKIAVNWTPAKARLVEAAAGAGGGAVLGGMAGSGTYTPRAPTHRIDPQGWLSQRDLTREEKEERWRRVLKAAAGGAVLGTGASLGASKVLRHVQDEAEKDVAKAILEGPVLGRKGLPQRKEVLEAIHRARHQDFQQQFGHALDTPVMPRDPLRAPTVPLDADDADLVRDYPSMADVGKARSRQERMVEEAKKLLDEEEQRLVNLAAKAREHRRSMPWGQLRKGLDGVPDPRGRLIGRLDAEEHEGLNQLYNRLLKERVGA